MSGATESVLIGGFLCHQGVDLNWQAQPSRLVGHVYRPVEASWDSTYSIVPSSIGAVEAQAQALDAMRLQQAKCLRGKGRGGTGCYGYLQTQCAGIIDHSEQILATEWVAAGKNQMWQGIAKCSDLAQQAHTLDRG